MRRRQYLALSTAFLTGCAGGGGSTPTPTATETSTPTPTESPTPSPTPGLSLDDVSFPDGVSKDGITSNFTTTHQQQLFGKPYTLKIQRTVEGFETTLTRTTLQIGKNKVHQAQTSSGGPSKSFWKDGKVGYAQANGGVFYYTIPPQIDRAKLADLRYIRAHIKSGNYKPVEAVRKGGQPVIKAKASDATASEYLKERGIPDAPRVKSIDEYSGTLTFTPDGLLLSLSFDWSYTGSFDGDKISEEYSYTVSKVGQTEVTQPSWLSTAKKQAVTFDVSMSDDDKYAVIKVKGEGSLPDKWGFSLHDDKGGAFTRGSVTVEGGDTVYVGLKDGQTVFGINEKPSGVRTLSGHVFIGVIISGLEVVETSL